MPVQINLTPPENTKKNLFSWIQGLGKYILLIVNILLFFMYLYGLFLERSNVLRAEKINVIDSEIRTLRDPAEKYDKMQKVASRISLEKQTSVDPVFILDFLRKSTPSGIQINSIVTNDFRMTIEAVSKDSITFSSFIELVSNEPRFSSVILTSSSYNGSSDSYKSVFEINYTK